MKQYYDMRKFLVDQTFLLIFIIALAFGFVYLTYQIPIIMIGIEIAWLGVSFNLIKHMLVFPLDLKNGHIEKDMYFKAVSNVTEYELLLKRFYCRWYFNLPSGEKLTLIIPVCIMEEEIDLLNTPLCNQKVKVCYYRYSKIVCSWKAVS